MSRGEHFVVALMVGLGLIFTLLGFLSPQRAAATPADARAQKAARFYRWAGPGVLVCVAGELVVRWLDGR